MGQRTRQRAPKRAGEVQPVRRASGEPGACGILSPAKTGGSGRLSDAAVMCAEDETFRCNISDAIADLDKNNCCEMDRANLF